LERLEAEVASLQGERSSLSDRLTAAETALAQRESELERIRSLLGLEWDQLAALGSDESLARAVRERARALFSVDSAMSIEQLQGLVHQQAAHVRQGAEEVAQLEAVIAGLKDELRAARAAKGTDHSTMDKLLQANRKLQAFIDKQGDASIVMAASANASRALSPAASVLHASSPYAGTPARRASRAVSPAPFLGLAAATPSRAQPF
jgi:septal ring factor EnvC (AmiA/AmiB activator)